MKKLMSYALSASFLLSAMPKVSFAESMTMDQSIQAADLQRNQMKSQLADISMQLTDLRAQLKKEKSRPGYEMSIYARNIAGTIAIISTVLTVGTLKDRNYNFIAYGLVASLSGIVALIGQGGVALTNDQVVALEKQIEKAEAQAAALAAKLK